MAAGISNRTRADQKRFKRAQGWIRSEENYKPLITLIIQGVHGNVIVFMHIFKLISVLIIIVEPQLGWLMWKLFITTLHKSVAMRPICTAKNKLFGCKIIFHWLITRNVCYSTYVLKFADTSSLKIVTNNSTGNSDKKFSTISTNLTFLEKIVHTMCNMKV